MRNDGEQKMGWGGRSGGCAIRISRRHPVGQILVSFPFSLSEIVIFSRCAGQHPVWMTKPAFLQSGLFLLVFWRMGFRNKLAIQVEKYGPACLQTLSFNLTLSADTLCCPTSHFHIFIFVGNAPSYTREKIKQTGSDIWRKRKERKRKRKKSGK